MAAPEPPRRALGIRGRLFAISLGVLLAVGIPGGLLAARWQAEQTRTRAETELAAEARLAVEAARVALEAAPQVPLDQQLRRLATAADVHFAVLDAGGGTIASSGPSPETATWPPDRTVLTAQAPAPGLVVGGDALTLRATRVVALGGPGVVWVGGMAALAGLLVAMAMSAIAAGLASRELRGLVVSAAHLARGERQRVPLEGGAEVEQLAGSFNRLSEQLESSLGELAASRARLEAVLESMQEALVVLDDDRRLVLVNGAAQRLFGLPAGALGRALVDAVRTPAVHALVDRAALGADDAPMPIEVELPRRPALRPDADPDDDELLADDEEHASPAARGASALVQLRCRRLAGGRGVLLVASDVTEVRRLETIRRDFVANVSHELRTPVAVIRANAETLAAGALGDPKRAATFTAAIHRNAERLSSLISDLLDLSRIESGRWTLETHPVPVLAVAQRVVGGLAATVEARRATVTLSVPLDRRVLGDARALEQILSNLVENAVKHSPEGCHVEVTEAAASAPGRIRVCVEDDGPGIAATHRERVFERFYRVDPGRSRAVGGTGLGLAIVRHLAEGMDGTVGLDAREPSGCRFWLELPLASPQGPGLT